MDKNIFKQKWFFVVVAIIIAAIILFLTFRAGMFYGLKKAKFNLEWGKNYGRYFGEPKMGFFKEPMYPRERMKNAFGNAGVVISVNPESIVIKGNDESEKVIKISPNTIVHSRGAALKVEDIKVGDNIIVIGEPQQDGSVEAKLIRVFR